MSIPALPHPTNFDTYGPGFAFMLASMASLSDTGYEACPDEWRDLTALLHTLILDEGMTTAMAAWEAAVPESMVAEYRHLVGI
jgi:hypothetical protein